MHKIAYGIKRLDNFCFCLHQNPWYILRGQFCTCADFNFFLSQNKCIHSNVHIELMHCRMQEIYMHRIAFGIQKLHNLLLLPASRF